MNGPLLWVFHVHSATGFSCIFFHSHLIVWVQWLLLKYGQVGHWLWFPSTTKLKTKVFFTCIHSCWYDPCNLQFLWGKLKSQEKEKVKGTFKSSFRRKENLRTRCRDPISVSRSQLKPSPGSYNSLRSNIIHVK